MSNDLEAQIEREAERLYEEARKRVSGRPAWRNLNPNCPYDMGMRATAVEKARAALSTPPAAEQAGDLKALKPCPFCRSSAVDVRDYRVHCETCGAFSGWHPDQESAIAAWNRRATPPAGALEQAAREMLHEASFLVARLRDFEDYLTDGEDGRQYHGHVLPSVGRMRSRIANMEAALAASQAGGWRTINEPPTSPMGVLLYVPVERHVDMLPGHDYSVQVGFWDGSMFCEQGTGHDLHIASDAASPTHWMPLPPTPQRGDER